MRTRNRFHLTIASVPCQTKFAHGLSVGLITIHNYILMKRYRFRVRILVHVRFSVYVNGPLLTGWAVRTWWRTQFGLFRTETEEYGRSLSCPSISTEIWKKIIQLISIQEMQWRIYIVNFLDLSLGLVFFIFMQLSVIFGHIITWCPPPVGAPFWELLDPPMEWKRKKRKFVWP